VSIRAMMIMTTNATPWTENRSMVLHTVPLNVLCLSDSAIDGMGRLQYDLSGVMGL